MVKRCKMLRRLRCEYVKEIAQEGRTLKVFLHLKRIKLFKRDRVSEDEIFRDYTLIGRYFLELFAI